MVFNMIIYFLFWIAYRYNTLYVNKFRFDTGGLVFPTAVKQLFTGLYVMEICLIGLFFLVRGPPGHHGVVCLPQAIIMIICVIATAFYQFLLNKSFGGIYEYLPITLEDDAVRRDQEYAKLHARSWGIEGAEMEEKETGTGAEEDGKDQRGRKAAERQGGGDVIELDDMDFSGHGSSEERTLRDPSTENPSRGEDKPGITQTAQGRTAEDAFKPLHGRGVANSTNSSRDSSKHAQRHPPAYPQAKQTVDALLHPPDSKKAREQRDLEAGDAITGVPLTPIHRDPVSSTEFFGAFSDEIQDLGPRERDLLVEHAFKHRALRARRPVIWIPRDELGVSDDEIRRTHRLTDWVWISNEGTGINSKNQVLFKRPPPDFSEIDLIDV